VCEFPTCARSPEFAKSQLVDLLQPQNLMMQSVACAQFKPADEYVQVNRLTGSTVAVETNLAIDESLV
jgi:hypothetical protein